MSEVQGTFTDIVSITLGHPVEQLSYHMAFRVDIPDPTPNGTVLVDCNHEEKIPENVQGTTAGN